MDLEVGLKEGQGLKNESKWLNFTWIKLPVYYLFNMEFEMTQKNVNGLRTYVNGWEYT